MHALDDGVHTRLNTYMAHIYEDNNVKKCLAVSVCAIRGGPRISEKEVHKYKVVGVRFADFIPFFLNIP